MDPIVKEEFSPLFGVVESHDVRAVLHRAGGFLMHAPVKEGVRNLVELSIQGHFRDQGEIATVIVAHEPGFADLIGAFQAVMKIAQPDVLLNANPAFAGLLVHEVEVLIKVSGDVPFGVYEFGAGISNKHGWIFVENMHGALKEI